ncbi:MAG: hypothetical protein IKF72_06945 [Kiritimatiellae bacterium]|nr:hypothetical protein [Kiritimatiellia bacterium]
MRSFAALAILAAFSHCALGAEDFAFTYRGCINGTSIPRHVDVQFALYDRAAGGTALWTATNSVMPATNGFFQCELAGDGLAAAFTNANARFLGVSIGGEAEQYPRQEVFAAPLVDQAESAASLAPNGSAERVYVTNLCAQTMSLGWLDLYGNLVFTKPTSSLTLTYARNWDGSTLILKKGGEVSLLRPSAPQAYSFDSIASNRAMFSTPSGGLVTVMSASSSDWDRADSVPCVTWAVSPGNIYPPFGVGHPVKVYFYPFGTAN